jgi:hypothetical protein
MNCTAFRTAIEAAVERRESLSPSIAAHLDDCRDVTCRACWNDAEILDRAIADWRRMCASIEVADAVVARCQSDDGPWDRLHSATVAPTRNAAIPAFAVGRAIAALVATVLVLTFAFWLPSDQGSPGRVAVRNGAPRPTEEQPLMTDFRPAQDVAGDPGAAYVAYAQSAAQIVTDAVVLTLGDSDEMEDARIAPGDIGWDAPWPQMGEAMDSALDEWLEAIPVDAPPS